MSNLSAGALAGIVIGCVIGAYFLAQILLACCYCCGACSLMAWDMGLGDRWHNRRRRQKKTTPATSSGHELQSLPRTAQEVNAPGNEESRGREKDAVSLSGVTIC